MKKIFTLSSVLLMLPSFAFAQGVFFEQANQRIELHRKSDISIEVVDSAGNAIENASVSVNMKRHDFR